QSVAHGALEVLLRHVDHAHILTCPAGCGADPPVTLRSDAWSGVLPPPGGKRWPGGLMHSDGLRADAPRRARSSSNSSRRTLSSVRNAARVLRAFSLHEPELGVTELAMRLGLGK